MSAALTIWLPPAEPVESVWDGSAVPAECLESLRPLGRMGLRDFYSEQLFASRKRRGLSARTLDNDYSVISRWEEHGGSAPKRWYRDDWGEPEFELLGQEIADPPIGWITSGDLERFADRMSEDGLAAATIQSTFMALSPIFNAMRPRSQGGLGAVFVVPKMSLGSLALKPKRIPTSEQLAKLWKACDSAKWPVFSARSDDPQSSLSAADWHRGLIVWAMLLGWRSSDLQSVEWSAVSDDLSEVAWTPQKTRRKKPYPQLFPIPDLLRVWLTRLRQSGEQRIFPRLLCETVFRDQWRLLLRSAGVSDPIQTACGDSVEWLTLHALRRACNVRFHDHDQSRAGHWLLHCDAGSHVNSRHYTRVYQPDEAVKRAVLTLPVPEWMTRPV